MKSTHWIWPSENTWKAGMSPINVIWAPKAQSKPLLGALIILSDLIFVGMCTSISQPSNLFPGFITDPVHLSGIMAPHKWDTRENTTRSLLLHTLSTNLFGQLLLARALLPSLLLLSLCIFVSVACPRALVALQIKASEGHTPTAPRMRPSTVLGRAWQWTWRWRAWWSSWCTPDMSRRGWAAEDASDEGGGREIVEGLCRKGDWGDWEVLVSEREGIGLVEWSRVLLEASLGENGSAREWASGLRYAALHNGPGSPWSALSGQKLQPYDLVGQLHNDIRIHVFCLKGHASG